MAIFEYIPVVHRIGNLDDANAPIPAVRRGW